jgi:hypothetical protein
MMPVRTDTFVGCRCWVRRAPHGQLSESTIDVCTQARRLPISKSKVRAASRGASGSTMRERHKTHAKVDKTRARAVYTDARPRLYTRDREGCLYACESRLYRCETSSIRVREPSIASARVVYTTAVASIHGCEGVYTMRASMRELSIPIPIASIQTKIASIRV